MKTIKWFNISLRIIIILGIAYLIMWPVVTIYEFGVFDGNSTMTTSTALAFYSTILSFIQTSFVIVILFKLRIATENYYEKQLFNNVVSKSFKHIGYLVILGSICYILFSLIIQKYLMDSVNFNIISLLVRNIAVALFFFTLSIMVDKAKGIQRENDLTI